MIEMVRDYLPAWLGEGSSKLEISRRRAKYETLCRRICQMLHWGLGNLPRNMALSKRAEGETTIGLQSTAKSQRRTRSNKKKQYIITMRAAHGMLPGSSIFRVGLLLVAVRKNAAMVY